MNQKLEEAVSKYEEAISGDSNGDSIAYLEACALFKIFLAGITDLGRKVWTNFDFKAITVGLVLLFGSIIPFGNQSYSELISKGKGGYITVKVEIAFAIFLVFFHSILLVMSNSYIECERQFCQVALTLLCCCLSFRMNSPRFFIIPFLSRIHDFLGGHGQDLVLQKVREEGRGGRGEGGVI